MQMPAMPSNEKERLDALGEYRILDSEAEQEFDDISLLAAAICQTPVSMITLIDSERQWFKSGAPAQKTEIPRSHAFCSHAINFPSEPFIISDMREDKRSAHHPFVTGDPHVVFYTGIPLTNAEGYALGTTSVLDYVPKKLSDSQIRSLKILAKQVMHLLELRKANISLKTLKEDLETRNEELQQFAYVVSHDIKSPLASIVLTSEMLRENFGESINKENDQLLKVLNRASYKIKNLVDGILAYYQAEQAMYEKAEAFNLKPFLLSIVEMIKVSQYADIIFPETEHRIYMNKTALEQILVNLLQNSLKYNDKEVRRIKISFSEDEDNYYFTVSDNGNGIEESEQQKIFDIFTTLGKRDRSGAVGTGIGLSTVKRLVEKMGGQIAVKSEPGVGSVFSFQIKKESTPES
jgi:signal transduction histidine kinase